MEVKRFVLEGPAIDGGLACVFKRYRRIGSSGNANSTALVLAHAVSTHKETWEPFIEALFQLQDKRYTPPHRIVGEIWSSDAPNHGQAAAINEQALLKKPEGISGYLWGRVIQTLLKSGLIVGRKVVGVGHSAGATIMALSTDGYPLHKLPFSSMILVEPGMMTREIYAVAFKEPTLFKQVIERTRKGKDIWPSRDAALKWLSERSPWKRWDPRVLRLFIEYGLRSLPTAAYPNKTDGITRACTREQEAQAYVYFEDAFDSLDRLRDLCHNIPVHTIFGTSIDLVASDTHDSIVDPRQGRRMASISKVDSGHLIPQENPTALASTVLTILDRGDAIRSKM